jgi:hypothetical protein
MYGKWWYMNSREKKDENADRKRARYHAEKGWKVSKFDLREVDHINWVSAGNWAKNLQVISKEANRRKWVQKAIASRKSRMKSGWKY